jgi:phosphate transport system substrate-binding protein
MTRFKIITIITITICAAILICSGCKKNTRTPDLPPNLPDVSGLSISENEFPRLDGSTSTIPLGEAIAAIMTGKDRAACKQYAKFTGTNEAYINLVNGDTDILVVYEMPDEAAAYIQEKGAELEIAPIGRDALVFIVNSQNPIDSLTTQQIIDIYSGKITNWQEVGGKDEAIAAYQRNDTSGSQTLMKKLVMNETPLMLPRENFIAWGMNEIITSVATYDNSHSAIGYNVYYYVTEMKKDPNIKILAVDGVEPNNKTIAGGEYPFVNDFYTVIRKSAKKNSTERLLFDWLQSDEGQMLIDAEGYVKR